MSRSRCRQCGREYETGTGYWGTGLARFNNIADGHDTGFCCEGCYNAYNDKKAEYKKQKEDVKARKKEKKEASAQVTSHFNLQQIMKIALIGGFFSAHRVFVGRIISALIINFFSFYGVFYAIKEREPKMLTLLLVAVAFWVFDLISLKAERFTDGKGHTIRNK